MIYDQGIGFANQEKQILNSPQTRFRIGILSQPFISTLALLLEKEGNLDLNAPLAPYFPDLDQDNFSKIKIKHLLQHRSGLKRFHHIEGFYHDSIAHPITKKRLLSERCNQPLVHEPGEVFEFGIIDYILLSAVIEKAVGQDLEKLLQEKIFIPLNLTDTGMAFGNPGEKDAFGYSVSMIDLAYKPENNIEGDNFWGSANLFSSTQDLFKFFKMVVQENFFGKDISKSLNNHFYKSKDFRANYLGWSDYNLTSVADEKMFVRWGNAGGFTSLFVFNEDLDRVIILLNNVSTSQTKEYLMNLTKKILEVLPED